MPERRRPLAPLDGAKPAVSTATAEGRRFPITRRRALIGAAATGATSALLVAARPTAPSRPRSTPMWNLRPAAERGHANHGWLDTHHTFSFARYYDPRHMGFGPLRVINDDRVAGGAGFPTHPHRDMEILTYVVEGALEHQDTTGGGGVIQPGDIQHMTAGTGVRHSEFNASESDTVRFLQIWIVPEQANKPPRYQQRHFPLDERRGRWVTVASPDGADGSFALGQDAFLRVTVLDEETKLEAPLAPGRGAWVQVATGSARLGDLQLHEGDGAYTEDADTIALEGTSPNSQLLVFDVG